MPMADETSLFDVVLGVGNPLMGDDGLGIAVVAHVQSAWGDAPELMIVDGGTWGMNLLPIIEQARRVLIIDAIDRGARPGIRWCRPRRSPLRPLQPFRRWRVRTRCWRAG